MNSFYKRLSTNRENYITTLAKLFDYSTVAYARRQLSRFVYEKGQSYTYSEFREKCIDLSHRMSRFGIGAGDKVAILSQNMPNWTVAMFSTVPFGRVSVPILPDSSESEVSNTLTHSEAKALFISKRMLPKLSEECKEKLTLVFDIETFELIKKDDKAFTCEGWVNDPQPDTLAAIIYTSGTSGKAKGVMLSHRNLCQNIIAAAHAQKAGPKDRWLSILPMSHTYEMAFSLLYPLYAGGCVFYIKRPPTPSVLMGAMKIVRPTIMCTVPLIMEKIYKSNILPTINRSRVLTWMEKNTPHLLYHFVGQRLRRTLGGKLKFVGIGGSKLDPSVEEFYHRAHFPYAIGYGLTETAPLITNACVGKTKVGSIGVPAYKVQVKLQDVDPETGEGEIVVKGDNVMLGYYRDPERTRRALTDDGWFRTGDLATVDSKGRYYIKGRIGSMIVGASGENIYPEEIEQVINNVEGVSESLVLKRGDKLVALVNFDQSVIDWNQEGEDKFFENLEARRKAIQEYVNRHVSKQSKVNDVEIMKEPFEKTATHKIRRFLYRDAHGINSSSASSASSAGSTTSTPVDGSTASATTGAEKEPEHQKE